MNQPVKIDLLIVGHTLDSIKTDHGDFDAWFADGLGNGAVVATRNLPPFADMLAPAF